MVGASVRKISAGGPNYVENCETKSTGSNSRVYMSAAEAMQWAFL